VPGFELESYAVVLRGGTGSQHLARALRRAPIPVLGRVQHDSVMLDARTLLPGDSELIEEAILAAIA
jgi:hypothetical protein